MEVEEGLSESYLLKHTSSCQRHMVCLRVRHARTHPRIHTHLADTCQFILQVLDGTVLGLQNILHVQWKRAL